MVEILGEGPNSSFSGKGRVMRALHLSLALCAVFCVVGCEGPGAFFRGAAGQVNSENLREANENAQMIAKIRGEARKEIEPLRDRFEALKFEAESLKEEKDFAGSVRLIAEADKTWGQIETIYSKMKTDTEVLARRAREKYDSIQQEQESGAYKAGGIVGAILMAAAGFWFREWRNRRRAEVSADAESNLLDEVLASVDRVGLSPDQVLKLKIRHAQRGIGKDVDTRLDEVRAAKGIDVRRVLSSVPEKVPVA